MTHARGMEQIRRRPPAAPIPLPTTLATLSMPNMMIAHALLFFATLLVPSQSFSSWATVPQRYAKVVASNPLSYRGVRISLNGSASPESDGEGGTGWIKDSMGNVEGVPDNNEGGNSSPPPASSPAVIFSQAEIDDMNQVVGEKSSILLFY